MINISKYSIGTPERCVADYLNALHKRAFTKMCNHIQHHFMNTHEGKGVFKFVNVPSYLKNDLYKYIELKKAEILHRNETKYNSNVIVDIVVKLTYFDLKGPKKKVTKLHLFRVIKETPEGEPSEFGHWGVNPMSTLRGV